MNNPTPIVPVRRIAVGISGASGIQYGIKALQLLRDLNIETHLMVSKAAHVTRCHETDLSREALEELANVSYSINDIGAALSSGSFSTMGMIVAPCSMRTLAAIASGVSDSLLTRAADVTLKERRRLVLMVRETPLHLLHLRNMQAVTECGAIVFPPVPAFYTQPKSLDDIVTHSVVRALDLFGLDAKNIPRWGETIKIRQREEMSA
jgi:4-hydroxy-3-polyprenylbenzoate decarboxylase